MTGRALVRAIALAPFFATAAQAALLSDTTILETAGEPLEQRFLGADVSVVRTQDAVACVQSVRIEIENSVYFDHRRGERVAFEDVIRSFATSAQFIAAPDGALRMRIQFKYSLAPDHPVTLHLPDRSAPLDIWREPAGDSVLIEDPEMVSAIRAAMEMGKAIRIVGRSLDTGRIVDDALPAAEFTNFDLCVGMLPSLPSPDAVSTTGAVSVEFASQRDEAFRIRPEDARICAPADDGVEFYLGALQRTTGFFSQTSKVFVSYTAEGEIGSVYIPGIFEARGGPDSYEAELSRAANANDPLGVAETSGCLGAAPMEICAYPGLPGEEDVTRFGPCIGALTAGDLFEDPTLLAAEFEDPSAATRSAAGGGRSLSTGSFATALAAGGAAGGGGGGFAFGGGSAGGSSGGAESPTGSGATTTPPPLRRSWADYGSNGDEDLGHDARIPGDSFGRVGEFSRRPAESTGRTLAVIPTPAAGALYLGALILGLALTLKRRTV